MIVHPQNVLDQSRNGRRKIFSLCALYVLRVVDLAISGRAAFDGPPSATDELICRPTRILPVRSRNRRDIITNSSVFPAFFRVYRRKTGWFHVIDGRLTHRTNLFRSSPYRTPHERYSYDDGMPPVIRRRLTTFLKMVIRSTRKYFQSLSN